MVAGGGGGCKHAKNANLHKKHSKTDQFYIELRVCRLSIGKGVFTPSRGRGGGCEKMTGLVSLFLA